MGHWLGFQGLLGSRAPVPGNPVSQYCTFGHESAPSNCLIYMYLEVLATPEHPFLPAPSLTQAALELCFNVRMTLTFFVFGSVWYM